MIKSGIIYVDFDNTILIWKGGRHVGITAEEAAIQLMNGENIYADQGILNDILLNQLLKYKANYSIHMLSHCLHSYEFNSKVEFLKYHAPMLFEDFHFVDSVDSKVLFLQTVRRLNERRVNYRVIMVDDSDAVRLGCKKIGVEYYSPTEVMLNGME